MCWSLDSESSLYHQKGPDESQREGNVMESGDSFGYQCWDGIRVQTQNA